MKPYGLSNKLFLLPFFIFFTSFLTMADEPLVQEELYNLNHGVNWQPTHDVQPLANTEEGIKIICTGSDPYIITNPLDFSAGKYQAIQIEMMADSGSQAQVFWASDRFPQISEPQSHRFMIDADGKFHTYTLVLASHEGWTGKIQRLRLDPMNTSGIAVIRNFRILNFAGAEVSMSRLSPSSPFAPIGEPLTLSAMVKNEGDVKGEIQFEMITPPSVDVLEAAKQITLKANREESVSWKVKANEEGAYPVQVRWEEIADEKYVDKGKEGILSTFVQISKIDNPQAAIQANKWQARFYQTNNGIGPIQIRIKQDNQWNDMAWIPRAGKIAVRCEDESTQWIPFFPTIQNQTARSFHLRATEKDRDGRTWIFSQDLIRRDSPVSALSITTSISCDQSAEILHFAGPELYIGENSFGRKKDLAILPGVEYLDASAVSSSSEVAHPPVRDQYMPHPYKVTIPLMALTYENRLISMMWPPNAKWAEEKRNPSPKFAVPNRLENQENHLFGLYVPTVPDYVQENHELAYEPYELKKDEPLVLACIIYMDESDDPNDAVDAWNAFYNDGSIPEPLDEPRSYRESIEVSRKAYMTTCWNEEEKGWGHCAGWSPYPSGGMLALLKMDQFLSITPPNEDLNQRIQTVYDTILKRYGPKGLGNSAGCHVMTFEPAFFWGVSEFWLSSWRDEAKRHARNQNEDGSWGFHISRDQQKGLGEEGEVVSGTISPTAMRLLRLARITADPVAAETGLKSLDALNRRSVPRGAQGWECPIAAADIMVSAQAARANLDAYKITGDQSYLDYARYWARTGIVFHYLWYVQDRPLQMYATIPIFGTTFFTHSWRGVPVQWCGLVYAYAMQELADYDESHDWQKLAEGITTSALYQQLTDGPYAGTLPDSYGDYFQTARGAYINPENIMTNLHALKGNSFNIRTAFPGERKPDALRISVNADLSDVNQSNHKLSFTLQSKEGRLSEILIAPMQEAPNNVFHNKRSLSKQESLFEKDYGWKYVPEHKTVLIHVKHKEQDESLVIETK